MKKEKNTDKVKSNANHSNTYDDVFQSLKANHTKLFIPLINFKFNKDYSLDEAFELLPTDEYITNTTQSDEKDKIEKRISDFIIKIRGDKYILECQSYNDGSMALRIAEYTFLTARQDALAENGKLTITMPSYSVIYIRSNKDTPKKTEITYIFPNGEEVNYSADNILLNEFKKEEIIEKKLFILIPFYLLRYESILKDENASKEELEEVENDLYYFYSFLQNSLHESLINQYDHDNLLVYTNMIIRHVTNGNNNEKELKLNMGGKVIVTQFDILYKALAEKDEALAEKDEAIAEKDEALAEKDETIAEKDEALAEKDETIAEKDAEIARLTKLLEEKMI